MVFKTTGILITSVDQLNLKNMNNISYMLLRYVTIAQAYRCTWQKCFFMNWKLYSTLYGCIGQGQILFGKAWVFARHCVAFTMWVDF